MPGLVQSVERAAAILRLLAGSAEGMGVSEVARSLSLPKGTAHGLLRTLRHVGFVDHDSGSGRYRAGAALARLSLGHIDLNELRSHCINWADPLAAHSGEAVHIGALSSGEVLIVHHVFRPYDTQQTLDVGSRMPAHASALGKVLLAHDTRATALALGQPLTAFTRRTLIRPDSLRRDLAEIRAAGWGAQVGEQRIGTAAIAAPIRDYGGLVVAAIGISGDVERICDAQRRPRPALVSRVRETALAVSRDLAESRR